MALIGTVAQAESSDIVVLPSGLSAHLHEIIEGDGGSDAVTRLRFVADAFTIDAMTPDAVLKDMTFLCMNNALPHLGDTADGRTVIISMADRVSPFGVIDASLVQIFEVFTIADGTCIWEAL